jgi:hypothetical protein
MAKKLDPKQTVDLKEVVISEIIQSEALVNLLERRGSLPRRSCWKKSRRFRRPC